MTAWEAFIAAAVVHFNNSPNLSQIGYMRVGRSVGGEAYPYCTGNLELLPAPNTYTKSGWLQYYADMVCALSNVGTLDGIVAMNQALADASPGLYPRLKVPTLIITGSEDFTRDGATKLQSFIKGSELVSIDGAGHANCFEMPWEYDRLAIAYLKKRGLFPGGLS